MRLCSSGSGFCGVRMQAYSSFTDTTELVRYPVLLGNAWRLYNDNPRQLASGRFAHSISSRSDQELRHVINKEAPTLVSLWEFFRRCVSMLHLRDTGAPVDCFGPTNRGR